MRRPITPLPDCLLFAFVDTAYLRGRSPETLAAQLCAGGADLIQLRAKEAARGGVLEMARAILPICQAAGVGLVINDWPDVAREAGAPLCHLGQEDFFDAGYTQVRQIAQPAQVAQALVQTELASHPASPGRAEPSPARAEDLGVSAHALPLAVGLSTHAPAQAERAVSAGADYIAIGPVFATGTKPGAVPVTLDYVRWAAGHIRIPWFAIGGITPRNLDAVLEAGARRVCVVSAILDAPDVQRACREFKNRLTCAAAGPGA
jgi:thiamine-phosphate pyrophosphorylase